jgi:hypothetical protein
MDSMTVHKYKKLVPIILGDLISIATPSSMKQEFIKSVFQ